MTKEILKATLKDAVTLGVDEDKKPIALKVPYAVAMPDTSDQEQWLKDHVANFGDFHDFANTVNRFCDAHFSKGYARTDLLNSVEEKVAEYVKANPESTTEDRQQFARDFAQTIEADIDNPFIPAPRVNASAPAQQDLEAAGKVLAKLKAGGTTVEKVREVCAKFNVTIDDEPTAEQIGTYFKRKRLDAANTSEF